MYSIDIHILTLYLPKIIERVLAQLSVFAVEHVTIVVLLVRVCSLGYAGGMGKTAYVQQHQQAGAEEEPTGCVGRIKLVR